MKKLFLLLFLSAILFSCDEKTKENFTVQGNIKGLQSSMVYLSYENGGEYTTDSILANDGRFTFNGKVGEPSLAYLQTRDGFGAEFVLENADIHIDGNIDSVNNVRVNGGEIQQEYNTYLASQKDLMDAQKAIYGQLMQERDAGNEAVLKEQMNKVQAITEKIASSNKQYIKQHPRSFVSLFLLKDMSENLSLDEIQNLYSGLSEELKNSSSGKLISHRMDAIKNTAIGAKAMDFTQKDLEGKPVKLSDFKGKYVLLDFWASWCKPCRAENPNVLKAYNQFKDKNFTVLAVSLDGNEKDWRQAVKDDGMPWTQLSDLKGGENEVAKMYGITGIPASFLINPDGIIVAKNLRGKELEQKLAEVLN